MRSAAIGLLQISSLAGIRYLMVGSMHWPRVQLHSDNVEGSIHGAAR